MPLLRAFSCLLLVALTGCANYLGKALVTAPNLGEPTRGVDAPPDVMQSLYITRQLRVPVARDASLWVAVCDPSDSKESLYLRTDGRRLVPKIDRHAATMPATQPIVPRGTIFMLHGLQEDQSRGPYVVYREMLVHTGYRCVQVDLRGHGRSTGDLITYGVEESRDLKHVLDVMLSQDLIAGDVGVIGASYGAAIAIQWAAADSRIKAVVALEPFATLNDAAVDAAPMVLGHWRWCFTEHTLLEAVRRAGIFANFDPQAASALAAIATASQPVLIIHSRGDEVVPFQQSERLHAAAPDHSKLLLVDKQSHFTMWFESINLIRKESIAWLDKYVAHGKPSLHFQVPEIRNSSQFLTQSVK